MKSNDCTHRISELVDRLCRLNAADEWNGPLNPSQLAALNYLSKANRFSRAPSHVADYLATTRGTASQTLKALARKQLIGETRAENDRRSIRYDVTAEGQALLTTPPPLSPAIDGLTEDTATALADALSALVTSALQKRGGRSFGVCKTCRHHRNSGPEGFCALLEIPLRPPETEQICHEHTPNG
ncbi:MarR family transcriptional regulator [Roseibium denhamense]|uniref:Transcriptional regulator, MarR family n=1 Tax=Roseibium denhamense TaxID=76305 RepID=A0ABY1NF65_9HYPH|nr:MarR family winged helix-turn-helix transcriptional regulator [Roseibium denhamense]MTI04126.1 MarR family transcriptional regulator [Roseibium denhamense]SMP08162.1 transcriptional regulator, MarR family [Roseibium denhamense]